MSKEQRLQAKLAAKEQALRDLATNFLEIYVVDPVCNLLNITQEEAEEADNLCPVIF